MTDIDPVTRPIHDLVPIAPRGPVYGEEEPLTVEIALPAPRRSSEAVLPTSRVRVAAGGLQTLWTSSKGWRDRRVSGRLPLWNPRALVRRPSADVVAPPVPTPTGLRDPRCVPALALVVCLAGIVGLTMPVIEAADGMVSFAAIDIPYVGMSLLGVFLVVSLLPVVDVVRRRVTWTAWLVLPSLLCVLPVALLLFALSSVPKLLRSVWASAPEHAVGVGTATPLLFGADLALSVVGVLAIAVRMSARRARRAAARHVA